MPENKNYIIKNTWTIECLYIYRERGDTKLSHETMVMHHLPRQIIIYNAFLLCILSQCKYIIYACPRYKTNIGRTMETVSAFTSTAKTMLTYVDLDRDLPR